MLAWTFYRKYLFSNRSGSLVKRIAWLSLVGISIALFSFVLTLSVMTGLNRNIHERILSVESHLAIELPKDPSLLPQTQIQLDEFIKNHPELEVSPFDYQDVILRTIDGIFHGASAKGVTKDSLEKMFDKLTEVAKKTNTAEPQVSQLPAKGEVIIGSELARSLGVFEGDIITIIPPESLLAPASEAPQFSSVRVTQILTSNVADIDTQGLFYSRGETLLNFNSTASRKFGYEVWISDPYEVDRYKDLLVKIDNLKVETWKDKNATLFVALRLEKLVIGTFLGLSALIASFSIMSVLALLISQKKKEIGLLMAMGFSPKNLMKLFLQVGLILSSVGLFVGVMGGSLMAIYLEKNPLKVLPDIYYDSYLPARFEFSFSFIVLTIGMIITSLSVLLAVRRISKMTPAESLRSH